jgi:hypothetical protein
MKIFKPLRSKSILLFLLSLGVAFLSSTPARVAAQTDKSDSRYVWESDDDGWKRRVEIRGKAEYTDDYTDIKSISEGGYVRIEETRGGVTRRLDIKPDASGQLLRSYYLNNQARPVDDAARVWIAGIVLEAVRQSGIDADKRVERIYERRGLSGVLEEISLVRGDYAKRLYFAALLKNSNLNAAALQSILREAARQLSSDYEKAQLLAAVSNSVVARPQALPAFFEATATINSDYEHRRVLLSLLKKRGSNRELLLGVMRSAARISSDYEKGIVLKEAAAFDLPDAAAADAFFQAAKTISSDYEHRRVLSALLNRKGLSPEVLSRMLESAARMSSDYEKATFLLEASSAYAGDNRLRGAFLRTVDTIKSDYERGRVLSALSKNKQLD